MDNLELLKEELSYDKDTGEFCWKKVKKGRTKIGTPIGNISDRYFIVCINQKKYLLHKLAWYFIYGTYPEDQIDHIDQNTHNNSINNLRLVTSQENSKNKPKRRDNISGITGVSFDKNSNKWVVRIKNNKGVYENRGRFNTTDEAEQVRIAALIELGYSEKHGEQLSKLPYRKV